MSLCSGLDIILTPLIDRRLEGIFFCNGCNDVTLDVSVFYLFTTVNDPGSADRVDLITFFVLLLLFGSSSVHSAENTWTGLRVSVEEIPGFFFFAGSGQ